MFTRSGNFQTLRRHFYFKTRRAKLRVGAALHHWALPEWNPFLARELQRSLRHKKGPFWVLWPLLFIGVALALITRFRDGLALQIIEVAAEEKIPLSLAERFLGQNTLQFMALVAAGICGYSTWYYSKRAAQVFIGEKESGTFPQLLLLPLAEIRLAFLTSAPAAAAALALWFLLLPLWLLTLATNQWAWSEFLGLPLLLLTMAVKPPEWTPTGEEYVYSVPQDDSAEDDETTEEETDKKNVEADEQSSNKQEAASNAKARDKPQAVDDDEDPYEDEWPDYAPSPVYQQPFKFDPAGIIILLIIWQMVMFWAQFAGFKTPPSVFNYLLPHWRDFLPPHVWNLLPSILFSWPLLIIQLLVTPLPFFGIALPLGLWLVPRLVMIRYAAYSIFRLSYLGHRSLQAHRWALGRLDFKRYQAYLFWFFGAGFLWPWLIHKGAFAALLPNAPINASWARAGLWTILLIVTTWVMSSRFHTILATPFKKLNSRTPRANLARWRRAWRRHQSFIFWPIALYFTLCWLGSNLGIDTVWISRLTPTLLVVAAYLLADFSSLTLRNALPPKHHSWWALLRFVWFWGLFWEAVFRIGWAHYSGTDFALTDAPHLVLSPFVSLLALLNKDITLPMQGALWQLGLAMLLFAATVRLTFRSKATLKPQPIVKPTEGMNTEQSILWGQLKALWRIIWFVPSWFFRIIFWPIKTFFNGLYQLLRYIKNATQPFLNQQANELWQWIEKLDNPIWRRASKSIKAEELAINWLGCLWLQSLVLLILLAIVLIKPVSLLFYGGNTEYNRQAALAMLHWRIWGDVVFGAAMVIGLIANIAVLSSQTKAFDKERANGGMVFLFLTPLTEGQIVGGYAAAALVPGAWFQSALYPSILLAAALEIIVGRFAMLPLLLLLTVLLHTLLVWSAVASIWAAVCARNTGEGGAWATLCAIPQAVIIIVLLFIFSKTQGFLELGATAFGVMLSAYGTHLFWNDALRRLRRERFGDLSLKGTIAN